MVGFQSFLRPHPDHGGMRVNGIRNIQGGLTTLNSGIPSIVVDISEVDTSKSIILVSFANPGDNNDSTYPMAEFVSKKQIRISRVGTSDVLKVSWTVIEFINIKSIQTGQTSLANTTGPQKFTISQVNPSKCVMLVSYTVASGTSSENILYYISSPTEITFETQTAISKTVRWFVVEFF